MRITFLGTSACSFDSGDDTVHYLINDELLVDAGWAVVPNLRRHGYDPLTIRYLLFTHFHHDHYMGLAGLLFDLLSRKASGSITVYGPESDNELVVNRTLSFLQKERFYPTAPGVETVSLPQSGRIHLGDLTVLFGRANHPVDARSYVIEDSDGHRVGISGDTAPQSGMDEFFRGCRVLIHEASLGAASASSVPNEALHSGAPDAARLASAAAVEKLVLVHGARSTRKAARQAAQAHFGGEVTWPEPGETIVT